MSKYKTSDMFLENRKTKRLGFLKDSSINANQYNLKMLFTWALFHSHYCLIIACFIVHVSRGYETPVCGVELHRIITKWSLSFIHLFVHSSFSIYSLCCSLHQHLWPAFSFPNTFVPVIRGLRGSRVQTAHSLIKLGVVLFYCHVSNPQYVWYPSGSEPTRYQLWSINSLYKRFMLLNDYFIIWFTNIKLVRK